MRFKSNRDKLESNERFFFLLNYRRIGKLEFDKL
jgi:hypothetical protein